MSDDFDALLDAAIERKASKRETADVTVQVGGKPFLFRFTEMDSREWVRVTAGFPPRVEVAVDRAFGYDANAASEVAAPMSGVRVDGDDVTELTPEQWKKLFNGLSATGLRAIADTLFWLNEREQLDRLVEAKKAFEGALVKKRRSPAK